ncbi:MAG: DUF1295 domain-containing protein [Congregibacter sp.]
MNKPGKPTPIPRSLLAIAAILAVGAGIAIAGSDEGLLAFGIPAFALATGLAFAIQIIAFLPSYIWQTERYYDLVGALTYLSVIAFVATIKGDGRSLLLAAVVSMWALRLGSFLFTRILKDGSDRRFERIKPYFFRLLVTWLLQGLWVVVTAGAALAAMSAHASAVVDITAYIGLLMWLIGFAIEVVADAQKRAFRRDPANDGQFIQTGIWAWSRHPNYFGEILLWLGVAVIALPALQGWQYVTLISPVFVFLLLTRLSGVPALESHGKRRWGEDPAYQRYCANTPVLFLRPPSTSLPE